LFLAFSLSSRKINREREREREEERESEEMMRQKYRDGIRWQGRKRKGGDGREKLISSCVAEKKSSKETAQTVET